MRATRRARAPCRAVPSEGSIAAESQAGRSAALAGRRSWQDEGGSALRGEGRQGGFARGRPAAELGMTAVPGRHPPTASSPPASLPAPRRPFGGRACGGTQAGGAAIRIRLLGRFAVDHDGQEIALREFGGGLARRLLRLLALRRGTLVPKDLIADALWPDDPR